MSHTNLSFLFSDFSSFGGPIWDSRNSITTMDMPYSGEMSWGLNKSGMNLCANLVSRLKNLGG